MRERIVLRVAVGMEREKPMVGVFGVVQTLLSSLNDIISCIKRERTYYDTEP